MATAKPDRTAARAVTNRNNMLDDLTKQLKKLDKLIEEKKKLLAELPDPSAVQAEMEALETEKKKLNQEKEDFEKAQKEFDAKQQEVTIALNEAAKLKTDFEKAQEELKSLKQQLEDLSVAGGNDSPSGVDPEEHAKLKEALETQIKESTIKVAQLQGSLNRKLDSISSLEADLERKKTFVEKLKTAAKKRVAELKAKNEELEADNAKLVEEVKELKAKLGAAQNDARFAPSVKNDLATAKDELTEARKKTLREKLDRKKAEERATQAEDAQHQAEEARDAETARANVAEIRFTETQTKLTKTNKTNGLLKKIGIPLVVGLAVIGAVAGSFWGLRTVQAKEWEAKYGKETVQTTVAEIVGDYNQVDNDALYADMIDELVNGGKEKQAYKRAAVQSEDTTITDYQMIKATEEASDLILTLDETKTVSETSALGTAIKNYNAAADAEDKSGMKKYADEISEYSETMESYAATTNEKLGNMLASSELVSKAQVDVLIAQERDNAFQEGIAQGKADAEAERAEREFVLSAQEVSTYLSIVAPNAGSVGDVYCYYQNGYVTIIAEDCVNIRTMQTYTAYQQFKVDPNSLSDVTVSEIMDAVKTEKSGWDMVETLETGISGSTVTMTIDGEEVTGTAEVLFGYKQQGKSYKGSALVVIRDDAGNIIGNKIIAESTLSKSLDEIKTLVSEKVNNMYSNSVQAETENDME